LTDHTSHRSLEHDRIFGYTELQPNWTYEKFLQHVLLDDRAAVDQKFIEAVKNNRQWNLQCRIRRIDGEIRWIWAVEGATRIVFAAVTVTTPSAKKWKTKSASWLSMTN